MVHFSPVELDVVYNHISHENINIITYAPFGIIDQVDLL